MRISFHGAARTVTGSKHIIHLNNGKKILLDCGMFQGLGSETNTLNWNFGFDPAEITYMILSHSHTDHVGLVPKLVKEGYCGRIYGTPATVDLAAIMLEDSANIQETDIKQENKRRSLMGKTLLQPLYTVNDAMKSLDHFIKVPYDEWVQIDEDIEFCFTDAGHLIGSAAVHLRIKENGKTVRITFSGDIGRYRDVILRSPAPFDQADYILLESTYGDSLHEEVTSNEQTLLEWIEKVCLQRKGKLVMPAFSLGRTQEILYHLNKLELDGKLPELEYFVDSPLSYKTTQLFKVHTKYFNRRFQKVLESDRDPFNFKGLKFITSVEESKLLNFYRRPCVIISASGMAEAGRVRHHISNCIEDSRNAIVMTGYCEPQSLAARLLRKPEDVTIFGQVHQVNAEIGEIRSMSAHGDRVDIMQFLSCQDPKAVKQLFLVHGEIEVQEKFKNRLVKAGFEVTIPERHQEIGLSL